LFLSGNLLFIDLGFIQTDENLWVKYTDQKVSVPHFVISTTINPVSQTFVLKNLLKNETMSTNSFEKIREVVISDQRELKLNQLFN